MFDPERDQDDGTGPFYRRLAAIALVAGLACAAAWPSVSGFAGGPNHDIGCVAVRDGWNARVPAPSESDVAAVQKLFPPVPTPAQAQDPEFMDAWRKQLRTAQENPATVRANARISWLAGPGACVTAGRRRLALSAALLGGLLLVTVAAGLVIRARRTAHGRRTALT